MTLQASLGVFADWKTGAKGHLGKKKHHQHRKDGGFDYSFHLPLPVLFHNYTSSCPAMSGNA
jgi:hypothetical protein